MHSDYNEWRESSQLKQISIISFITATLYLIMSFVDEQIAPKEILTFITLFHLFLLPILLYTVAYLAFRKKFYSFMIRLLIFATIVAALAHTFVITKLSYYSSYHAEIYLIVFWVFAVSGLRLYHALFTSIVIVSISISGILYSDSLNINDFIMHCFWMGASFSFGFAGAYLLESSNKTVFAQQKELRQELNNKGVLLKELSHRVKNNLQIVSSILYSQSRKVDDKKTKEIFDNSIQTIKAMGMIHEKLYQSQNLDSIDFKEYIQSLITLSSQNMNKKNVHFSFDSKSIIISIENAVSLGLIVNEILTNTLKYATTSDNRDVLIRIVVHINEKREIKLHISDNGQGLDFKKQEKGFGTKLINSLVNYQLKGELDCFNRDGLHYIISFVDTKLYS